MKPREPDRDAIQAQKPAGSTGIQVEEPLPPWQLPGAFRRDCEPHRGNLVWWMAAISVTFSAVGLGAFVLPLSGTTCYLAWKDLAHMGKGVMDPSGERLTRDARDGSIVAILLGSVHGLYMLVVIFGEFLK